MPADASIYSLIQPQKQVSPFEGIGGMLQIKNLMAQQGLQGLQRQQVEESIAAKHRIRDLFSGGTTPTEADVMAADPTTGLAYAKSNLENKAKSAELRKLELEIHEKQVSGLRDRLASVASDGDLSMWRDDAVKAYGPAAVEGMPASVNDPAFKQWQVSKIQTGNNLLAQIEAQKGRDLTTRGQDLSANTALAGQRETNRHNLITEGQAVTSAAETARHNAVGENKDKALTESQGNATGFGLRAQKANDLLIGLENDGTFGKGSQLKQGLGTVPLIGGVLETLANKALPADQQKYEQAQRDFVNAVLRKESGANINKEEFENARKQYFPQIGDGPDVIEQKRKNRANSIQSLAIQAGAGASQIPKPTVTAKPLTNKSQVSTGGIKFLGFE